jgi:type II secretory pathway predicted ATPase ExeA
VRSLRRKLDDSELKRKTIQDKMLTMQEEWEQRMSELSHSMMQKQSSKIKGLEVRVQELQEMLVEAELAKEGLVEEKEELSEKLLEAVNKFEEMDDENENGILRKQLDSLLKEKTSLSSENNLLKDLILKQEKKDDEERELRSEKKPTKSNRKPTEQSHRTSFCP